MFNTITRRSRALAVAVVMLGLAACGGEASARDAAVDRAVADGMGREQAECIVNGVADAFGEEAIAEGYEGDPADLDQVFEITDDCLFGN